MEATMQHDDDEKRAMEEISKMTPEERAAAMEEVETRLTGDEFLQEAALVAERLLGVARIFRALSGGDFKEDEEKRNTMQVLGKLQKGLSAVRTILARLDAETAFTVQEIEGDPTVGDAG
jgi:hypothetical protein